MLWAFLDFLCCVGCRKQQDEESCREDETTHLIPPAEYDDLYDPSMLNQRRLDERLGSIIRSKEGKMVNVSSHLPFNLHNRVLPDDSFPNSRSCSRSVDIYLTQRKEHNHTTRPRGRHQWPSQDEHVGHLNHEPQAYSRSSSRDSTYGENMLRREPILNVRLVGYEPPCRGRSTRSPDAASAPEVEKSPNGGDISESADTSEGAAALTMIPQSHQVQFKDVELLCTSWGN